MRVELASEQRFEEISIRDICKAADLSLADFRDAFPSKGAVVRGPLPPHRSCGAGAERRGNWPTSSPRERLFELRMRRLEAMAPYREGLREVAAWLRRNPGAALAMNPVVINSMRFMLEAGGHRGRRRAGAIKPQGLALAWARIVGVWLDDEDPGPVEDRRA